MTDGPITPFDHHAIQLSASLTLVTVMRLNVQMIQRRPHWRPAADERAIDRRLDATLRALDQLTPLLREAGACPDCLRLDGPRCE